MGCHEHRAHCEFGIPIGSTASERIYPYFGGSEVVGYSMLLMDEDMSKHWNLSKQQPIPGCLCQQSSLATKSIIYACGLNKHEGEFK